MQVRVRGLGSLTRRATPRRGAAPPRRGAGDGDGLLYPAAPSLREPGLISDPKVNFSYFEIAMGRYGEVWARRNVYSAPPRYYKCTATHATPI